VDFLRGDAGSFLVTGPAVIENGARGSSTTSKMDTESSSLGSSTLSGTIGESVGGANCSFFIPTCCAAFFLGEELRRFLGDFPRTGLSFSGVVGRFAMSTEVARSEPAVVIGTAVGTERDAAEASDDAPATGVDGTC
jgi:hypothetical protein